MNSLLLMDDRGGLPPVPSREQVCGIHVTLQGLTVDTQQMGPFPYFGGCLAWLSPQDRQSVYRTQRAAGDTHCIVVLPTGGFYYIPGSPWYNPQQFPPMDWTANDTTIDPRFIALVYEVICEGFIPMVFVDEVQQKSLAEIPLLMRALVDSPYGDLTPYCLVMPGWDGVFYGWENDQVEIPRWAAIARSIAPNCYLGLEHNPGHIPLGEGGEDFRPGGKMEGFDVVLSEYEDSDRPGQGNDTIWQVNARLVKPYTWPADQPAGSDVNPAPFYLVDSPRGKRYHCAFEFNTRFGAYAWVRGQVSAEDIAIHRQYMKNMGCQYTG